MNNLDPNTLTIVYSPGQNDATLYENGLLIDCGHTDDVQERLIGKLGISAEYRDFVTDKEARGWSGVAQKLEDIP